MAKRDSRADIIDSSPFTQSQPKIHRIHSSTSTQRVEASALSQMFGNSTLWSPATHHKGKLWHFSEIEKQHLTLAMGAFTLALGFLSVGGISGILGTPTSFWLVTLLLSMPVMFIAVGPAFLLHEIGHKLVAKKNGCWAEFRADPKGLQMGLLLSFVFGFLFMAPGAVMVAGVVTRRQNGHIAIAGPLTNLGLFFVGIPMWALILGITGAIHAERTSSLFDPVYFSDGSLIWQAMLLDAGIFWLQANLILGLFNMLPFGPLDGLKVKDWSDKAFLIVISLFAILVLSMFTGIWSPYQLLVLLGEPISNIIR